MIKPYEKYKETKIKGIELIPESWKCTAIKHVLSIPITDGPHTTPELFDEGVPFISAEAIKDGKIDFNRKRGNISEQDYELFSKKYIPAKDDIYMVKSGATTGNVAMLEQDFRFTIWSPLAVFRADKINVLPKYLYYYLQSSNLRYSVEISWSYGTQQNIGMGVLSNLRIPYPTIQEQARIIEFLDNQTSIVDQLVQKKERLIELLKEKRQSIINESITKGLNPNSKLKDSGIESLGEIPESWRLAPLKHVASLKGRLGWKGLKADEYVEKGFGFLSTPDIKNDIIDFKNINFITEERYLESPEIMLEIGDVLLVKDGSTLGIVNLIKELPIPSTVNSSIGIIRVTDTSLLLPEYLAWLLKSDYIQVEISQLKAGQGVPHLFQKDIKNFLIILPPIIEQEKIINHINKNHYVVNEITSLLTAQIGKVKEYRQSMISEAVTGKIDLRNWKSQTKLVA